MKKTLCFFTEKYPYGIKSETFIESEIHFLARKFDEVIIFPSYNEDYCREIPENVRINSLFFQEKITTAQKYKLLLRHLPFVFSVLISEIKDKGFLKIVKAYKWALDIIAQQLYKYKLLKNYLEKEGQIIDLAYDYWFTDSVLALSFLKKRKLLRYLVTRSHRFDVFDEQAGRIGVPFRAFQMKYIDKMFTISNYNKQYLTTKLPARYAKKIEVSYLGVPANEHLTIAKGTGIKTIISCARMEIFKNIHLIPHVLQLVKTPVKWVHFGDGATFKQVQLAIQDLPNHIQVELKGQQSNTAVLEYYKTNQVDLFLSMSSSEGLPVSMMEALSFNVPILSYNVAGIPELVKNGVTGCLFDNYNDYSQVASLIDELLNSSFDAIEMRRFFLEFFNQDVNYKNFAEKIFLLYN